MLAIWLFVPNRVCDSQTRFTGWLALAGDHAGVVSGQPAPLLPDDALSCLQLPLMRSQFICASKRRGDACPAAAPHRPVFAVA
jgi:hypothetical protein